MAIISKIEICPYVESPFSECYCNNLTSQRIRPAIYYCGSNFNDCEIYVKNTPAIYGKADVKHPGENN